MKKGFWKNRSVLVTGGAGFIGSWICHDLVQCGAAVVSLDLKKSRSYLGEVENRALRKVIFISGDVRDEKKLAALFKTYAFDNVFHMAARAIVGDNIANPGECLDSNIRGTWLLLEAVRALNKRIISVVIASSDHTKKSVSFMVQVIRMTVQRPLQIPSPGCMLRCMD